MWKMMFQLKNSFIWETNKIPFISLFFIDEKQEVYSGVYKSLKNKLTT